MHMFEWGLLWYESDVSMEERVRNAAVRYEEKHGERPNICFVDCGDEMEIDDIKVIPKSFVLKNHAWIGVYHDE